MKSCFDREVVSPARSFEVSGLFWPLHMPLEGVSLRQVAPSLAGLGRVFHTDQVGVGVREYGA